MDLINNLYTYRELLKTNVKKDIRGKYKGSVLGVLWSFLNPLLMVTVYAIVFPYIMRIQTDHFLQFLICGIIPWNFFTSVMMIGVGGIRNNAGIIKKVYFPREILPISAALSGLVNFYISCIIIVAFCLFGGLGVSWHILFLPLVSGIQFVLTIGLVMALSAINVYIQDIEYIIQFVLNMMFYGTPILYTVDLFPESLRWILYLNPFTHLIMAYRDMFMYHQVPELKGLLFAGIVAFISFFVGVLVFRKLEKGFAEQL